MHEELKRKENGLWFNKVYFYYTNTTKPYSQLKEKDINKKGFDLICPKLFFIGNKKMLTETEVIWSINEDPDIGSMDGFDANNLKDKKWKTWKRDILVYGGHPITIYDMKLLINLLGVRLLRFVL